MEYAKLDPSSQTLPVAVWMVLTRMGHEAVMVFFVLSGFFVGGRAFELARANRFSVGKYVVDRLVRIQIPLTGAIALTVIIYWNTPQASNITEIAGNFFSLQGVFVPFLPGNIPLWSLSYEVWFYILGGAAAYMLSYRRFGVVPVLLVLAGIFVFTRLSFFFLIIWVAGAAAYQWKPVKTSFWWLSGGAIVAVAGVAIAQITRPSMINPEGNSWGEPLSVIVLGFGIAVMLPHLYRLPARAGWFASSGTWLASFSYSLYLIHLPLLKIVLPPDEAKVNAVTLAQAAMGIAITLLAAFIFSRIFETHGPRIKAWIHSIGRTSAADDKGAPKGPGTIAAGK